MQTIGIVLLNYNGYEDTINCMKSLNNQQEIIMYVVVVDNASTNSSLNFINEYVRENELKYDFNIISTDKNLGFAKGNNVGIKYLREEKKCEFVFVLNNDTLVKDTLSLKKLLSRYRKGIGVINPTCYDFDGDFQHPYRVSQGKMVLDYFQALALTGWQLLKGVFNIEYSIHKEKNQVFDCNNYKYIIQGNAYILTPDFFEYYTQIYPKTYLYFEELYLLWYLQKANLKTFYDSETVILHKESGSQKKTSHMYKLKKGVNMFKSVLWGVTLLFSKRVSIQRKYN